MRAFFISTFKCIAWKRKRRKVSVNDGGEGERALCDFPRKGNFPPSKEGEEESGKKESCEHETLIIKIFCFRVREFQKVSFRPRAVK